MEISNALSVDFEDWYHGTIVGPAQQIERWDTFESRIEKAADNILETFDKFNVKATFFVLGYLANKFPNLIRAISDLGHEIACHGYLHKPVYTQSQEEFRSEIKKTKRILESITGKKVIGYRAPTFSITEECLWAFRILREEGIVYDSSIFPVRNFRYGTPNAPKVPYSMLDSKIIEFPLSTLRLFKFNIPIAGGFYLRAMPYYLFKKGLSHLNSQGSRCIIYFHPWEIDTERPKVKLPLPYNFIHYYNSHTMINKINKLLRDFKFTTVKNVLML